MMLNVSVRRASGTDYDQTLYLPLLKLEQNTTPSTEDLIEIHDLIWGMKQAMLMQRVHWNAKSMELESRALIEFVKGKQGIKVHTVDLGIMNQSAETGGEPLMLKRSKRKCVDVSKSIHVIQVETAYEPIVRTRPIVGMSESGQIHWHADFLQFLWVLADKQMRLYHERMGKEDNIANEAFRWARAKTFNCNKTSMGRAIAFGCRAVPPAVICLCIVLRYLTLVQVMTLVEVVLGKVLLGVVDVGADAVPQEMRTIPRTGGFPRLHPLTLFLRVMVLMLPV